RRAQGIARVVQDTLARLGSKPWIFDGVVVGGEKVGELRAGDVGIRKARGTGIVEWEPAVHLVVEVRGVELEIPGGEDESPMDLEVSADAQEVAGGERAEITRVRNLRYHHLGHALRHLPLGSGARKDEHA